MKNLILKMLKENTGKAMLDSGGDNNRAWQRNQTRDFASEPEAVLEDGMAFLSVYHHLINTLELDEICNKFNALPCLNWDSEIYGISDLQEGWLEQFEPEYQSNWNSYNWDNAFDQVIQGTPLLINNEDYLLLQIHGGADVRGGYTDAKLFKVQDTDQFLFDDAHFPMPDGSTLYLRGTDWLDEDDNLVEPPEDIKIKGWQQCS